MVEGCWVERGGACDDVPCEDAALHRADADADVGAVAANADRVAPRDSLNLLYYTQELR